MHVWNRLLFANVDWAKMRQTMRGWRVCKGGQRKAIDKNWFASMPMFYVYCLYSVNTDVVWGGIERETRDIHNNNCKTALYLCRMCVSVSVNSYASFCRSYKICTLTEFHFVWNIFKVNAKRISFTIIRNPPYSLHFSLRFSVPVECYRRQYFPYEAFTQLFYAYTAATTTTTIPTTAATAAVHEDREQGEMERVRLSDAYAKYFSFSTSQLYDGVPEFGFSCFQLIATTPSPHHYRQQPIATYSHNVDVFVCSLQMQEFKVMTHDKHFCLYTLNRNCSCLLLLIFHWMWIREDFVWFSLLFFSRVINSFAHGWIRASLCGVFWNRCRTTYDVD